VDVQLELDRNLQRRGDQAAGFGGARCSASLLLEPRLGRDVQRELDDDESEPAVGAAGDVTDAADSGAKERNLPSFCDRRECQRLARCRRRHEQVLRGPIALFAAAEFRRCRNEEIKPFVRRGLDDPLGAARNVDRETEVLQDGHVTPLRSP
jgi:hypothetical protein